MIKTVTLNPAIDKTVEISNFRVGEVNRISSVRVDAGGKGINVSKIIKALDGSSIATGILAGKNGEYVKGYLDQREIENDFLFVQGDTRVNLKVVDKVSKTNTDINEPGFPVAEEDLKRLEAKVFSGLGDGSILVLSGSTPANVSKSIYKSWITKAKSMGVRVLLDADGELLQEGIKASPYLIKPNIHELERLLGRKLDNIEEIIAAAKQLIATGIEMVVVSLGADGAVFVEKDRTILAEGLYVIVSSTVGAGDSMVAALAFALEKGYSLEKAVTLSVAASAANVASPGTQPPELNTILLYEKQVRYSYK